MPPTEFDGFGPFDPGALPSPPDPRDHGVELDEAIVLPRRFGIGPPYTTYSMAPVTNQGVLPECGGYTGIDVKRYEGKVEGRGVLNLNPHWLYGHSRTPQRLGFPAPAKGTTGRAILETLRLEGVPIIGQPESSAVANKIGSYGALPFAAAAIKRAMVQYKGPVVFGMAWPESFFAPKNGIMPAPSGQRYGHLLEGMFYDDDVDGGSVLLQNHWRTTWGNGGRAWCRWSYLLDLVHDVYKVLGPGVSVRPT